MASGALAERREAPIVLIVPMDPELSQADHVLFRDVRRFIVERVADVQDVVLGMVAALDVLREDAKGLYETSEWAVPHMHRVREVVAIRDTFPMGVKFMQIHASIYTDSYSV